MEVNPPQPVQHNIPVPNQPLIPEIPKKTSSRMLLFVEIVFVVVILAGISMFLFTNNANKQITNTISIQPTILPSIQLKDTIRSLSPISTPEEATLSATNAGQISVQTQYVDLYKGIDTLSSWSGCAMSNYKYQKIGDYPVMGTGRVVFSDSEAAKVPDTINVIKFKIIGEETQIITFPENLPTKEDFLAKKVIIQDMALDILDGKTIFFSNYMTPKSSQEYYKFRKKDAESITLMPLRDFFCNTDYKDVESAIRVVWEIKTKTGLTTTGDWMPRSDRRFYIYLDAITGETVSIFNSIADDKPKIKPIPQWDTGE